VPNFFVLATITVVRMTLYFSDTDDDRGAATEGTNQIIENHPDYVSEGDDGELIINVDVMPYEKIRALVNVAETAADTSDEYRLAQSATLEWVPMDEREDNE